MVKIYGIKNCDTMKKARSWLRDHDIAYDFYNYKKDGVDASLLRAVIAQFGWENVINRRGTSWRQLDDAVKDHMDAASAVTAAIENPSLIKRPLLQKGDAFYLGFKPDEYAAIFGVK